MNARLAYQLAQESWTASVERLVTLGWAMEATLRAGVPGSVVELGCSAGHTSVWLADCLRAATRSGLTGRRELVLLDSFQGLPEPTGPDAGPGAAGLRRGELAATEADVRARFVRHGLPTPRIVGGWLADTIDQLPDRIALAYLDLDLFEPTLLALRAVWPRLAEDALVILDDYADPDRDPRAWTGLPGVRRAVETFLASEGLPADAAQVVPGVADYRATAYLYR